MKTFLLLLVAVFTMISCGETTLPSSMDDLNKGDIIGTWGMYKSAMDTGDGELSILNSEIDIDSIVPSIKFTEDSIFIFSSITNETVVKSYVFNNNSVIYDHPKINGQKKILFINFDGEDIIMKTVIEEASITLYVYCHRLE